MAKCSLPAYPSPASSAGARSSCRHSGCFRTPYTRQLNLKTNEKIMEETAMSNRLRQICLVANQLAPVIDDFKDILGLEVCFIDKGVAVFGLENSLMPVGSNFIEVVAPIKENTAAGRYLQRRKGDGGYMVICQCDSHEMQQGRKARAAAMNVRIAWEHESKRFHGMQLH